MAMHKQIKQFGNSLGIVIEKPILELLGITKDTVLEMTTDGKVLTLRPAQQGIDAAELADHLEALDRDYGEMFRNLAK